MFIKVLATGSSGNCYLISDGSTTLLIEAGLKVSEVRKKSGFKLSNINGALITHEHLDHCKYIEQYLKSSIDVFTHKEVINKFNLNHYRLKEIKTHESFLVRTFTVIPFEVEHDVYNLNFLIYSNVLNETLLYITDTPYIPIQPDSAIEYMIVEANHDVPTIAHLKATEPKRYTRVRNTHMAIETLESYLKQVDTSRLKQINLIHTSSNNAASDEYVERIKKITGTVVKLGIDKGD